MNEERNEKYNVYSLLKINLIIYESLRKFKFHHQIKNNNKNSCNKFHLPFWHLFFIKLLTPDLKKGLVKYIDFGAVKIPRLNE